MTCNLKAPTPLDLAPRPLTDRQMEVYRWIWDFTIEHGYQPGFREIIAAFDWHSPNAVRDHLAKIAARGWIEAPTAAHQARAIRFRFAPDGRPFRGLQATREREDQS